MMRASSSNTVTNATANVVTFCVYILPGHDRLLPESQKCQQIALSLNKVAQEKGDDLSIRLRYLNVPNSFPTGFENEKRKFVRERGYQPVYLAYLNQYKTESKNRIDKEEEIKQQLKFNFIFESHCLTKEEFVFFSEGMNNSDYPNPEETLKAMAGSMLDSLKIGAILSNRGSNHLQVDSNVLIHDYNNFYAATFGALEPTEQFLLNVYVQSKNKFSVNCKVMFTPEGSHFSTYLLKYYNKVLYTPPTILTDKDNLFFYKSFQQALWKVDLLDFDKGFAPIFTEEKLKNFAITKYIFPRVIREWSHSHIDKVHKLAVPLKEDTIDPLYLAPPLTVSHCDFDLFALENLIDKYFLLRLQVKHIAVREERVKIVNLMSDVGYELNVAHRYLNYLRREILLHRNKYFRYEAVRQHILALLECKISWANNLGWQNGIDLMKTLRSNLSLDFIEEKDVKEQRKQIKNLRQPIVRISDEIYNEVLNLAVGSIETLVQRSISLKQLSEISEKEVKTDPEPEVGLKIVFDNKQEVKVNEAVEQHVANNVEQNALDRMEPAQTSKVEPEEKEKSTDALAHELINVVSNTDREEDVSKQTKNQKKNQKRRANKKLLKAARSEALLASQQGIFSNTSNTTAGPDNDSDQKDEISERSLSNSNA